MPLNPDGVPAGFTSQAGATAYLIDPGGAYSPAAASAATTDPAGTSGGADTSIPITGVTSEIVDPADTLSGAGASAPTTDPAGRRRAAGASAPTLVAPGTDFPATGAASSAAEIVGPAGAYSLAGASAATINAADRDRAAASALTLAAPDASFPATAATSAAAEIVDPADTSSGASAATIDAAGASASTLASPDASIPATGATSAAAQIVSPPGTYLPPGATAPIADPGGTYSGAGASAPTTDPAGTYSSPYALNRLIIIWQQNTPANVVLSFDSVVAVENYYGVTSPEAALAKEFFAGYAGTTATLSFTRYGNGQRPHLLGANISSLTLPDLQSINGTLTLTFDGFTYSGYVDLSGVASFSDAALKIKDAINSHLQVAAVTTGSSITKKSVSFTGYTGATGNSAHLYVTSVSSGTIEIGGVVSGHGLAAGAQIIDQLNGTPGGPGEYSFFQFSGAVPASEAMTETYGELTVGSVTQGHGTGTVAVGERVTGAGVPPLTAIDTNISGDGPGSKWVVNNALNVAGDITMTAPSLTVENQFYAGATENNDFFEIQPNGVFGFDHNRSYLSYMGGTAADALGLTQASGAINSSPGGQHLSVANYMNHIVQDETNQFGQPVQFGSFQSNEPRLDQDLAAWAQSIGGDGYQFLTSNLTTPPAGSSTPVTDPAGTYSPAGASAPTPATPGTSRRFLKGPFTSEKGFDTAIDSVNASTAIQDEAETYEARVWASDALSKYLAPYGQGLYGPGLEFWVESPTLQINVQVEPTPSTLPPGLTQSESVFLQDINSIEPDTLVANAAYNDTQQAYAGSLGLGATAAASGNTIWAYVYGPETTTIMMVHPT